MQSSVQFSRFVVSNSLWPHELQHSRPPCPSPTAGVYTNPCPLSQWGHPTISVAPFSSCPQSFPASGSFQMRHIYICIWVIYIYIFKWVIYLYICIYMYVCMYVCMYVYIYIYVCVCMYICVYICMYVCVYIYIYIYVYVYICMCVYIYIYIYTHTYKICGCIIFFSLNLNILPHYM